MWRHHLTWWRHLDIALSRISWLFSVFRNFFKENTQKTSNFKALLYAFEGKKSNGDKQTSLASTVDLENPDQLPVKEVFEGILMIMSQILSTFSVSSHNLFERYVFEVKKSISDISTELPCSGDLENPGQLPVQGVLEGTDDWVLWIFKISPLFMFSRSGNSFLIFLLRYHVRVTSKIQTNFRYRGYLKVLMIESYEFLKFLHYLCFRGRGIHFWYSHWATMFGWPRKSRSTSGTEGTWRYWWFCLMDFHNFFSIYVFEVK